MRPNCIIFPGILLGLVYSVLGLACFAISRNYIAQTCGIENLNLQQWVHITGIIYYIGGLFFSCMATLVDYDIKPDYENADKIKKISCCWIILVALNITFTLSWAITGALVLTMGECQTTNPLSIIAIVSFLVFPTIGSTLSCIIVRETFKYRDSVGNPVY